MIKGMQQAATLILEGSDGCGKTYASQEAAARLRADGLRVTVIADPGTSTLGQAVRHWLAVEDGAAIKYIDPIARFLLYQAARVETERQVVEPALQSSDLVIFDRWVPSTEVFQYRIAGLDAGLVSTTVERTCRFLMADVALYLRADAKTLQNRLRDRSGQRPPALELIQAQIDAYDEMIRVEGGWQGDHWHVIDTQQPLKQVVTGIVEIAYSLVGIKRKER